MIPNSDVMVSVCCISYNHQNYIRRCLESLVNQTTDFRYEIVVHDDASTDGTPDIIREYAERYPDLIVPILQVENQYSKGVRALTSAILSVASGKYIVEIEGDDFWCDSEKLKLQVEALESHPECSACVHATDTVDRDGKPQSRHLPEVVLDHPVVSTEEYMRYALGEGNWMYHLSSCMTTTDLFREYESFMVDGYPSLFCGVGDLPQYLYFALKGGFYYIDRVMTIYTLESGGFMTRLSKDPKFALKVHQGYIDGLTAFDEYSDFRYHEYVSKALVVRKFEVARINRRFDQIVQNPEFRHLLRGKSVPKAIAYYAIGFLMLVFRGRDERG